MPSVGVYSSGVYSPEIHARRVQSPGKQGLSQPRFSALLDRSYYSRRTGAPDAPTSTRPLPIAPDTEEADVTYQDVFTKIKLLEPYGIPLHYEPSKTLMPDARQDRIQLNEQTVPPWLLARYYRQHLMGKLEECGDMIYEYAIFDALRSGIISREMMQDMLHRIFLPALTPKDAPAAGVWQLQDGRLVRNNEIPVPGTKFEDVLKAINNEIKPAQVKAFQKTNAIHNPDQARRLLTLALFKFMIFESRRDPQTNSKEGDITALAQKMMLDEAQELDEKLEGKSWLKKQLLPFARLYAQHSGLPSRWFHILPEFLIKRRLGGILPHEDILAFVLTKQQDRQQVDYMYYYDDTMRYNNRKGSYKAHEGLDEAAALRRHGILPSA